MTSEKLAAWCQLVSVGGGGGAPAPLHPQDHGATISETESESTWSSSAT